MNEFKEKYPQKYTDLITAHTKVKVLREKILPASEKAFEAATEGYEQGKFGYLDVLDARRALLKARLEVLDSLTARHESAIALEGLTGTPLNMMNNNKEE